MTATTHAGPPGAAAAKPRILVVDDEPSMREMLRIVLRRDGYEVALASDGRQALELLQREPFDLLLSDIRMPDVSGVEVLRVAKDLNRDIVAFMMTAYASTSTAVEAMRLGAVDYFTKPFSMDELRLKVRQHLESHRLKQENVLLKRALNQRHEFSNIIGRSDAMLAVFTLVETIAQTPSTVLITGESGTGKDLVARAVHYNSLRREHPFVALNCGAIPETLLESELFGHVRGAFTGADTNKKGLIEMAERGTVFLDEIGEMNATMQVKLLRVLQDRRFRRLGGTEEVQADIRIIAATNQDLPKLVEEGRFREDLFYRINVIPIHLPPLRERREDIPLLAEHFLQKFAAQMHKPVRSLSREAEELMCAYDWPGNVRELENAMERAVALEQTPAILPETLPAHVRPGSGRAEAAGTSVVPLPEGQLPPLADGFNLEAQGEEFYRHYMQEALERAGGVQTKAAELLGMSFRSFRYYAKKLNLARAGSERGMTIIELAIVLLVIGILLVLAVFGFNRARVISNESSAAAAMRSIYTGQSTFAAVCGAGHYAQALDDLGSAPTGGAPFISPDLTGSATVVKSGYRLTINRGLDAKQGPVGCTGGDTWTGYRATAIPVTPGNSGSKSYAVNQKGAVWQEEGSVPPTEPFGPPSVPTAR